MLSTQPENHENLETSTNAVRMQLRDHPLMSYCGTRNWPPVWTDFHGERDPACVGEVGTLTDAVMHKLIDNKCFLLMEFFGKRYMGCLTFDDPGFCRTIFSTLKAYRGRSIKDVGDVDLTYDH